jgi:serine/threonine protein kinase
VYLCSACQEDPKRVLDHLLEEARDGHQELATIEDYTLLRELGRGGMGAVFLARHRRTGEQVAIKLMMPKSGVDTRAAARFLREVDLARRLRHPRIAAVYESGCSHGVFFFTVEYCAGGDLSQLVENAGGRLAPETVVPLAIQALEALEYAHDTGIVHRDLSPHNILLTGNPPTTVKLCDFGLAKAFDEAGLSGLTRTGTTAGKPYFMPRQQVVNFRHARPDVDVWALAACLYHALTGYYPRDFPIFKDPWQVVLQTNPVPIRKRDPTVPPPLAAAIDEALREPSDRPGQTAAQFRQALDKVC